MISLRLVGVHTLAILRELGRNIAFVIPTLGFPAMFFALFGLPYAKLNPASANFLVCSFAAFALVGVTLFQFGVGVAVERGRPWERYLRSLPVSVETRFVARIAVALIFGICSAGLVAIEARLLTPVDFTATQWLQLAFYTLAGATPFVLLGIALAYWVAPRGALPVTNIVYLLCSYAGGYWMPPQYLPSIAAKVSPFLPTRQYGELLWSVAQSGHDAVRASLALSAFAAVFALFAIVGYRRDEKARYA
ncbi:MAG TPA: ABC transporter permease [Candidatus Aquilonibacter sp.]